MIGSVVKTTIAPVDMPSPSESNKRGKTSDYFRESMDPLGDVALVGPYDLPLED